MPTPRSCSSERQPSSTDSASRASWRKREHYSTRSLNSRYLGREPEKSLNVPVGLGKLVHRHAFCFEGQTSPAMVWRIPLMLLPVVRSATIATMAISETMSAYSISA
jgi:hypothetical protein